MLCQFLDTVGSATACPASELSQQMRLIDRPKPLLEGPR